jgi:hypothetical protein
MSALGRGITLVLVLAVFVVAVTLQKSGIFGLTLFVLVPAATGGLAAALFRPKTGVGAAGVGALANAVPCCSLLVIGMEGMGCVAMCIPLVCPLGALGGAAVHHLRTRRPECPRRSHATAASLSVSDVRPQGPAHRLRSA